MYCWLFPETYKYTVLINCIGNISIGYPVLFIQDNYNMLTFLIGMQFYTSVFISNFTYIFVTFCGFSCYWHFSFHCNIIFNICEVQIFVFNIICILILENLLCAYFFVFFFILAFLLTILFHFSILFLFLYISFLCNYAILLRFQLLIEYFRFVFLHFYFGICLSFLLFVFFYHI